MTYLLTRVLNRALYNKRYGNCIAPYPPVVPPLSPYGKCSGHCVFQFVLMCVCFEARDAFKKPNIYIYIYIYIY